MSAEDDESERDPRPICDAGGLDGGYTTPIKLPPDDDEDTGDPPSDVDSAVTYRELLDAIELAKWSVDGPAHATLEALAGALRKVGGLP